MKIAFKIPKANVQDAAIQMENQYFLVADIAPLCETEPQVSCDGTSAIFYVNIMKTIQSAGRWDGTTFTAATAFQTLDNPRLEKWQNFQYVDVSKFKRGVVYLIPVGQFAPVDFIPNFEFSQMVAGVNPGTDLEIFRQEKFRFDCPDDNDILNATSIAGCITVELMGGIEQQIDAMKTVRKVGEVMSFNLSTGNNQAALQAESVINPQAARALMRG